MADGCTHIASERPMKTSSGMLDRSRFDITRTSGKMKARPTRVGIGRFRDEPRHNSHLGLTSDRVVGELRQAADEQISDYARVSATLWVWIGRGWPVKEACAFSTEYFALMMDGGVDGGVSRRCWSGLRGSNPCPRLGKPLYYHCTKPA